MLVFLAVLVCLAAWYVFWPYPEREGDGLVTRGGNRISSGGTTAIVSGRLARDARGCLTLEGQPKDSVLSFERGTEWATDHHTAVRLPNGRVIALGEELRGGGGFIPGAGQGVGRCLTHGDGQLVTYWSDR